MERDGERPVGGVSRSSGGERRIVRAPEPRAAPHSQEKSLLMSRHVAEPVTRPVPQGIPASNRSPDDVAPVVAPQTGRALHPHLTDLPAWGPEPPAAEEDQFWEPERDFDTQAETSFSPAPTQSTVLPAAQRDAMASFPETTVDQRRDARPQQGRPDVPLRTGTPNTRRSTSPGALNPVVPPQSVAGRALILVVGIMCFLACLSVGALVLVEDAARDWQLDVSREVTIQVKPIDGKAIEPMLQSAMDLARATSGVRNVRLMSERDSEGLLEPWLGTGFDFSKLPVPRLILIDLSDPASADLKGLALRLAANLPNAGLDDHSIWSKRLRTMADTMVAAGIVVLVLVLTAMVLSVIFATRAAMAGNRDVVQVLHFVGAEDSFIAGEFQQHFLILGLKGGIGGGVGAMLAFLIAGWVTAEANGLSGSDQAHALFGGVAVGFNGYLGAAGIILLVAGLTALTSRLTVRSYLNQLD